VIVAGAGAVVITVVFVTGAAAVVRAVVVASCISVAVRMAFPAGGIFLVKYPSAISASFSIMINAFSTIRTKLV
jgi:hypothetical protein